MFALSWPGVRYCMEALPRPKRQEEATAAIARAGRLQPATAHQYLQAAHRLGLVHRHPGGKYALAFQAEEPEELIKASTLVRLFHAWHALEPRPLRFVDAGNNPLRTLGVGELGLLRSADAFARRIHDKLEGLPPKPALLLEIVRLWAEAPTPSEEPHLFSSLEAFRIFEEIHAISGQAQGALVEQFVRACMILYGKNIVRLGIMQYALDANRPYAPFRSSLGYIKWIHEPAPLSHEPTLLRGVWHAEPVQATRKLVSFG
ncbi:MAG TPA: hypothetical protein VLS89_10615 [Candidatus Nanopelagicales bacterium]|nr:hypothetical protein [Candidatus Nanopelagicales bacterium]